MKVGHEGRADCDKDGKNEYYEKYPTWGHKYSSIHWVLLNVSSRLMLCVRAGVWETNCKDVWMKAFHNCCHLPSSRAGFLLWPFLSGCQPLTPALMLCCSQSTPPKRSWKRDSSRPSLTPKDLGCCDPRGQVFLFFLTITTTKREYDRKCRGKCHETKCCSNPVPNQPLPVRLHCQPSTEASLPLRVSFIDVSLPKEFNTALQYLFVFFSSVLFPSKQKKLICETVKVYLYTGF